MIVYEREEGSTFDCTKAKAYETYEDYQNNLNFTELTLFTSDSQLDVSLTYDIRNTLESI